MPLWGKTDAASNAAFFAAAQLKVPANTANRTALYANSTNGAFVPGVIVGQFGVDNSEVSATTHAAHSGWNLKTTGTGYLSTLTVQAGGSGYNNNDVITIDAGTGGVNATATLTTNSTGGIISTSITSVGSKFATKTPTVSFANSTGGASGGSSANVVPTMGGRAGRVQYETLVAMGSLTS